MHMRHVGFSLLVCVIASFTAIRAASADGPHYPFLHPLFQNDMVMQRDALDPVWGWTEPGKQVTVSINGKTATATAGSDGKWLAKVGPLEAGGPYDMTISGPQDVKLTGVLVGDVWLCSGQSNMGFGINMVPNAAQEVREADHPQIRLLTVPNRIAFAPQQVFSGETKWLVCSPSTISQGGWNGFSAVAYFFGRDLQREIKVPIGLINSNWGGTFAEAWVSAEGLKPLPELTDDVKDVEAIGAGRKPRFTFDQVMDQWYAKYDPGVAAGQNWANAVLDDTDWKTMKLPGRWSGAGVGMDGFYGIVYFRRSVHLPPAFVGQNLTLHLGPIDDRDTTWVNDTKVGFCNDPNRPRDYDIPAKLTQTGKLLIAVRVLDISQHGGIVGRPDDMRIELTSAAANKPMAAISLAEEWKIKPAVHLFKTGIAPNPIGSDANVATVLYNGMIAPLTPAAIKGVVWYQGESNTDHPANYRPLLAALIRDWRGHFGSGEFPFLIAQIAAWGDSIAPERAAWADVREAQGLAARDVGHSAIAVLTDIGEDHNVHPPRKQEVGHRLMLGALAIAYGKKIEYSGPVFHSLEVKGAQAILSFDHIADGLRTRDGAPLQGFTLCGADGKFVAAMAVIDGNHVIVSAAAVASPTAVRFAWSDNPKEANLINTAGLPAVPFRTDGPR